MTICAVRTADRANYCTRPAGHKGPHVAVVGPFGYFGDFHVYAVWTTPEPPKEYFWQE